MNNIYRCLNFLLVLYSLVDVNVVVARVDAPAALQPGDLSPGDTFFIIFVTSGQVNYNQATTSAAIDTDGVNAAAAGTETSGVVGWRSLYAFETSAGAGTLNTMDSAEAWGNVTDRPIYTTTRVRVANNRADMLDGTLLAAVGFDENGATPVNREVFTGLTSVGAIDVDALGTNLLTGSASGRNDSTTGTWLENTNADVPRHLYVLSPLLVIPGGEPNSKELCLPILADRGTAIVCL